MFPFYVISLIILGGIISSAVKSLIQRNYSELISALLLIPFFLFFFISVILGGSAFHNAETEYEYYQAGHYYLVSHGVYTEVTYDQYMLAKFLEIVGISSWVLSFVRAIIQNIIRKRKAT